MDATHETRYLVLFRLERQIYALPIEPIVQFVEMVTLTPLPQADPSVVGVMTVRGAIVPVVALRQRLGLPDVRRTLHTPIILVRIQQRMVGLIVDEMLSVVAVSREHVLNPRDVMPVGMQETPILAALLQTEVGTALLLDLEHIFHAHAPAPQMHALVPHVLEPVGEHAQGALSAHVSEAVPGGLRW